MFRVEFAGRELSALCGKSNPSDPILPRVVSGARASIAHSSVLMDVAMLFVLPMLGSTFYCSVSLDSRES